VRVPGAVRATFGNLPGVPTAGAREASHKRASIVFSAFGLEGSGFAELRGRFFTLRERVQLVPGHVWAESHSVVEPWGMYAGGLLVSIATPFKKPSRISFVVPCDALGYGEDPPAIPSPDALGKDAATKGERLEFFQTAGKQPLFFAETGKRLPVRTMHDLGAWAFVRLSRWSYGSYQSATVEGWVRSDELEPATPAGVSLDRMPVPELRCPNEMTLREADVRVGREPNGPVFATLAKGAFVRVLQRRGEFASIDLARDVVHAPPGNRWWVERSALSPGKPCNPQFEE
jgi:hypothetical protein